MKGCVCVCVLCSSIPYFSPRFVRTDHAFLPKSLLLQPVTPTFTPCSSPLNFILFFWRMSSKSLGSFYMLCPLLSSLKLLPWPPSKHPFCLTILTTYIGSLRALPHYPICALWSCFCLEQPSAPCIPAVTHRWVQRAHQPSLSYVHNIWHSLTLGNKCSKLLIKSSKKKEHGKLIYFSKLERWPVCDFSPTFSYYKINGISKK